MERSKNGTFKFQSTRPIRGATVSSLTTGTEDNFNPRAPYGARLGMKPSDDPKADISIHAPHTGRDPIPAPASILFHVFQSTRPIRGATFAFAYVVNTDNVISIHAPHTGRDSGVFLACSINFAISIHAPHTGRDAYISGVSKTTVDFNPRAPYGARLLSRG